MPRRSRRAKCGLEPYKDTTIFNLQSTEGSSTAPLLGFTPAQLLPGLQLPNQTGIEARTVVFERFDITFIPKAIINLSSTDGQALQVDNLVQVRWNCPSIVPTPQVTGADLYVRTVTDHPFRVLSAVNPRMIHFNVRKMEKYVGTVTYPVVATDDKEVLQIQLKNWDQGSEELQIRIVAHVMMIPQLKPIPASAPTVVNPRSWDDQ